MLSSSLKRLLAVAAAGLVALPAHAGYSGLVVFGDSLSDSGNNFLALNPPPNPPTNITPAAAIVSNAFVPTFTYAPSASYPLGVYSNGPVWATSFAASLGLSASPSLAGGTNFAFGGAQTSGGGSTPSLTDQANMFLGATGGVAPGSYLYVVAGGGNNARAALAAIGGGADIPSTIAATAFAFAADIGNIVDGLQLAGADDIVVWNSPNLGLAPAVRSLGLGTMALAAAIGEAMNGALAARLAGEAGVDIFDLFGSVDGIVANPAAYGLSNATDACIEGLCPASEYLFWDGIHPSARGHEILAAAMLAQVVPEPQTALLVAIGLMAIGWRRRRSR
jgi:outer membrane lipase/esterase